jgi:hypothetical protein
MEMRGSDRKPVIATFIFPQGVYAQDNDTQELHL